MRRDGGDLLSGLGPYAFFSDRERNLLLRLRRFRLVGIGIAALVAVSTLLIWAAGGVAAMAVDASGTSIAPMWLGLLPLGVLAVCGALSIYETLLRRRRAQADEAWQGAHLVNKELVSAWVVSAGRRFSGSTGLSRYPLELLLGAVLLLVVPAALIIANAALSVAIRASAHRSVALSWVTTVSDTNYAVAWRTRDRSLARATAAFTKGALPLDERSQARFLASIIPAGSAPNVLLPRQAADSTLFAASDAPSPEALVAWRAVAHGSLLPLFWPFRSGAAAPEGVAVDQRAIQSIAAENLRDARRAISTNDLAQAELRARENLAVVRQLMRAGSAPFMALGTVTADAADVLDQVGRKRNDHALVAEAAVIRGAGVLRPTSAAAGALFADPTYLPIARLVADTLLEPATRVQLAQLAAAGFCENPREVLFGPSPSRTVLARQAAEGLHDLGGAERLVRPWDDWLEQSIATGATPMTAVPGTSRADARPSRAVRFATGLFRLHGLRSRLAFCSPN
jgi:hypothetical protein